MCGFVAIKLEKYDWQNFGPGLVKNGGARLWADFQAGKDCTNQQGICSGVQEING